MIRAPRHAVLLNPLFLPRSQSSNLGKGCVFAHALQFVGIDAESAQNRRRDLAGLGLIVENANRSAGCATSNATIAVIIGEAAIFREPPTASVRAISSSLQPASAARISGTLELAGGPFALAQHRREFIALSLAILLKTVRLLLNTLGRAMVQECA